MLCSDKQNASFHPVVALAACLAVRGEVAWQVGCMAAQRRGAPTQQTIASRSGEMKHLGRMSCSCVQFCSSCFCATKSLLINDLQEMEKAFSLLDGYFLPR